MGPHRPITKSHTMLSLVISCITMGFSNAEEPAQLYSRLVAGTGWVRAGTEGVGTGWVVDLERRRLVTNLHVVGEKEIIEVFFAVHDERGALLTERDDYLQNQKSLHDRGLAVRGKVIARRPESDLALIELNSLPKGVRAIPLAEVVPRPSDSVCSVGHRHDSEGLWCLTMGEVRQLGRWKEGYFWRGKRLAENAPVILVQSPINTGDSGSALANERGEVVGVLSAIRWNAPNTAVAIAVSEVRALLDLPKKEEPKASPSETVADRVTRATVWVKPTATEGRAAGWILDDRRGLILTTSKAIGTSDRVDIVFPVWKQGRLVSDLEAYRDRLELVLNPEGRISIVRGIVLARDKARDLALIEVGSIPPTSRSLLLATHAPKPGDPMCTIHHPSGVDSLWLYTSGTIRQRVTAEITTEGTPSPPKFSALLLQIPSHGGSAGSPVVNATGEVVGVLAAKEAPQQQLGYALTATEITQFLDSTRGRWAPSNIREFRERCRVLRERGYDGDVLMEWADYFDLLGLPEELDEDTFGALLDYCEILAPKVSLELLEVLERGYPKVPLPPRGILRRAECWALLNRPADSLKVCEKLLKTNPRWGEAWYVRSLSRTGKDALADLDEALHYEPTLLKAYLHRAKWWEQVNEREKAIADLSRAIELAPYSADPVRRRLNLYLQIKDSRHAIADGERLMELLPLDDEAFHLAAVTQLAKGDEEKAIAHLRSMLRIRESSLPEFVVLVVQHAEKLRVEWPDDPAKADRWVESALKMASSTLRDQRVADHVLKVLREPDPKKRLDRLRNWKRE